MNDVWLLRIIRFEPLSTAHEHQDIILKILLAIVAMPIDHTHYRPCFFCSCIQLAWYTGRDHQKYNKLTLRSSLFRGMDPAQGQSAQVCTL